MNDTTVNNPVWMVLTFKHGAQIRTLVEEYTVRRNPISNELTGIDWTTHDDSPTKIMQFDIDEVAAVHTEYRAEPELEHLRDQTKQIADWLVANTDEPQGSYGAVDAAINVITRLQTDREARRGE